MKKIVLILGCLVISVLAGCRHGTPVNPGQKEVQENTVSEKTWVEPTTGMIFVWIPAGCCQMGQTESGRNELIASLGEAGYKKWFGNELPRHEVCVDGFWMGKYEVTVAEFRKFIEATSHRMTAKDRNWSWCMTGLFEQKTGMTFAKPGFEQNDRHPVVHVSWFDANAMAEWLTKKNSSQFRLPTEAEWEYACRGNTGTARFWGNHPDDSCVFANAHDNTSLKARGFPWPHHNCEDGYVETAPVGSYTANGFGLHDMLGNVFEWCRDSYSDDAYASHVVRNPFYSEKTGLRVVRGGGWYSAPGEMRCAIRRGKCPTNTDDALGFRLIRIESSHIIMGSIQ